MILGDVLKKYSDKNFSRFHVPGNKGLLDINPKYDVTELDCTDDLYCSTGVIKNSEKRLSEIYGSGCSVFSTGGNTLCIQTMLYVAVPRGANIIVAKNVHKSVVHMMGVLDITPIWVDADENNVSCENIKNSVMTHPEAKAVFVTSPDYFGAMANIKKIKSICGDLPLLVDNAHGSHLIFFKDSHPLVLGADLCADSAHKTLPVLTGGAFLHIGKKFKKYKKITYQDVKYAMQIFGSTSPSFLILESLEKCVFRMGNNLKSDFFNLKKNIDRIKKLHYNILFRPKISDPIRLVFDTFDVGICSQEFIRHLEKFKIKVEFGIDTKTVLIPSVANELKDFERLNLAIENIPCSRKYIKSKNQKLDFCSSISIRRAMFSKNKNIPIEDAENKISAQVVARCPPGFPVVIPGEMLCKEKLSILKDMHINHIRVVI